MKGRFSRIFKPVEEMVITHIYKNGQGQTAHVALQFPGKDSLNYWSFHPTKLRDCLETPGFIAGTLATPEEDEEAFLEKGSLTLERHTYSETALERYLSTHKIDTSDNGKLLIVKSITEANKRLVQEPHRLAYGMLSISVRDYTSVKKLPLEEKQQFKLGYK